MRLVRSFGLSPRITRWRAAGLDARCGLALVLPLIALGCQGTDPDDVRQGVLIGGTGQLPGAIQGMRYEAADQSGFTDAAGTFRYRLGAKVRFSVGAFEFEPVDGAPEVSPFQLANGSGCAVGGDLTRVLQLVQSIDEDGNPDNGLQLPQEPMPAETHRVRDLDPSGLQAAVAGLRPGAALVPADLALDRFIRLIDDEQWEEQPPETFELPEMVSRTQGVATDGASWYFSSAGVLERTSLAYETQAKNAEPIPPDIYALGGNHIGDIDVHDGVLYAPIEDGPAFQHPFVVTFDAATLAATGTEWSLPQAQQTQGVPWVAVDGVRNVVYTSDWDPVDHINVYDLGNGLAPLKTIPLTPAIGRIQGAKVFGGEMYASRDDDGKTIYKIDLDTGAVMKLFALGATGSEVEGLALIGGASDARMRILDVVVPTVVFEARLRTRGPLRDRLCP